MAIGLAAATAILRKPIEDLYNFSKGKVLFKVDQHSNEKNARKIAQKVMIYDKVRTIWQKSKVVRITDMYYPPKIKFSEELTAGIDSLEALPKHQNFVIEGTVGQGKSIFLRYLCLQELGGNSTGRIPVLIELRTLEKYQSIELAIKSGLENLGFNVNDELYAFYLESGKLVLLLDAFDELPSKHITSVMEELETLCVRFPELQIIVTSRPERDVQKSVRFDIIRICPLSENDFEPFLKKINVPTALRNSLITALSTDGKKVAALLTTPLMLTLAAYVYRAEREIPAELPQFFEVLFQTVFTAHDKTKIAFTRECKSGLDDTSLQRLFETFCYMALQEGNLRSLKSDFFEKAYIKAQKYSKESCKLSDFKHDIVQVACLMQAEGSDTTFIHQSIQEYYSASFIKNCISDVAQKFYQTVRVDQDRKWGQVLSFLKHIDEYRWAKFFRLPIINEAISQLDKNPNVYETLISKCVFYCNKDSDDDGGYSINAFSNPPNKNKDLNNIGTHIMLTMARYIEDNPVPIKNLPEIIVDSKNHDISSQTILATKLLSTSPILISNVDSYIQQALNGLTKEKENFEMIVNLEESKMDIFQI